MVTSLSCKFRTYALASGDSGAAATVACGRLTNQIRPPASSSAIANVYMPVLLVIGLLTADGHLPDQQRRRCHRAPKFQVGAGGLYLHPHLPQIRRDGDLRNRIRKLAVFNPQAGGAARIIAGDDVDALADQFRHVEAAPNSANYLFRRALALLQKEVAVPHAGVAGDAARRVAGGSQAQLSRRVAIQQVTLQHAAI